MMGVMGWADVEQQTRGASGVPRRARPGLERDERISSRGDFGGDLQTNKLGPLRARKISLGGEDELRPRDCALQPLGC